MAKRDYLPSNILEYQNMVQNIRAQVTKNMSRWDISSAAATSLDEPIANLHAAVMVSENPTTRTSAAISRRNEAREALDYILRPFIQGHLIHNLLVTDDDLIAMGLPVHDRKPTPHPPPKEIPKITIRAGAPGALDVVFGGQNEKGNAKPDDVHGLEARWVIADKPPVDWSELLHSEFATRSPLSLTFEGHDRGKWIYIAARWENSRGLKGPWTDIFAAVIP
jgi:hypothetical protein